LDTRLLSDRFPRSNEYHPQWMIASASSGANALWLPEWLSTALDLRPGMRILDLGCGRAISSIFLHREFNVEVWATDLWFSASENLQRIRDAGADRSVYPIYADARALPFAADFFDAIISIDSFPYYGTDEHYLNYLARFVKPDGVIGIAGAGVMREFEEEVPTALKAWWEPNMSCLHSAAWWRRHWERTGILSIDLTDSMPDGWQLWIHWLEAVAPDNLVEIDAVKADRGDYLGYVRAIGRRRPDVKLNDPITSMSVPPNYVSQPLLRRNQ
jgi:cyclopropane fatty-acyl-phospholipid synthase-like methyltransferase